MNSFFAYAVSQPFSSDRIQKRLKTLSKSRSLTTFLYVCFQNAYKQKWLKGRLPFNYDWQTFEPAAAAAFVCTAEMRKPLGSKLLMFCY